MEDVLDRCARTEEVSRHDLEQVSHQLEETKQKLEALERALACRSPSLRVV